MIVFKVSFNFDLSKGNCCFMGSREIFFMSVGRQNNNNNPKFHGRHIKK